MADPLVLALGGSLLRPEESERHAWLSSLANLISECKVSIGIVVGGGVAAREAIDQLLDEKIAQRLVTLQPALEQTVIELQRARQDWLAEWERGAVQLTTAIAARVVRREIEKKPEISTELIREALELAAGFGQVKIHLNPQDHTALGSQVQTLAADLANLAPADIIADDSVTAGGCRVETQFGSIDQQIESQLERIAEELM